MPDDTPPRPDLASLETPGELAAEAERCEARARYLRALAASLEAQAVVLRRREGLARTGSLPRVNTDGTLKAMDVDTAGMPVSVVRGVARAKRDHPALRRIYEAGLSVTTLAKELREGRPRVSSWMAKGDAWRPIPPHHAKTLRTKYGIPESDWRRVE